LKFSLVPSRSNSSFGVLSDSLTFTGTDKDLEGMVEEFQKEIEKVDQDKSSLQSSLRQQENDIRRLEASKGSKLTERGHQQSKVEVIISFLFFSFLWGGEREFFTKLSIYF